MGDYCRKAEELITCKLLRMEDGSLQSNDIYYFGVRQQRVVSDLSQEVSSRKAAYIDFGM